MDLNFKVLQGIVFGLFGPNGAGRGGDVVEQYSRGVKQSLHVARAWLTDPTIRSSFVEEPTMGLEPFGAQEFRQLIPELVSLGKTVMLTTN